MSRNINLLFLLLFGCSQVTLAEQPEQRWYKVEVVAFSYLSQIGMAQERWPANPPLPDLSDAVQLTGSGRNSKGRTAGQNGPVEFQRLPASELELKPDAHAISRSKGRHLLLHTAWLQKSYERQQARPVHLFGDELFTPIPDPGSGSLEQSDFQRGDIGSTYPPSPGSGLLLSATEPDITQAPQLYIRAPSSRKAAQPTPTAPDSITGTAVTESAELNILDGSFTLGIGRYLHIWLDFIYREPVAISPHSEDEYQEFVLMPYRIEMHRRMRSNELHYIDHPRLGMLVKISRYKLPQIKETPADIPVDDLPIATDVIPAR